MTDAVADMIIRIKNAYLARKQEVRAPHTKLLEAVARLMQGEKYLEDVKVEETSPRKTLVMTLRYVDHKPAVTGVRRLSKPGLRRTATVDKIPRTLGGYGLTVLSTSQGIMSGKEAKKKGVGGEILCSIW